MQSQGPEPIAPPPPMPTAEDVQTQLARRMAIQGVALQQRIHRGANWLYWIAGLTAVNSISGFFHLGFGFSLGLGLTQLIDALFAGLAEHMGSAAHVAGFGLDMVIIGIWAGLGMWANKLSTTPFWIGIGFFAADTLICLYFSAFLSVLLHGWALFAMWGGLQALKTFKQATGT